MAVESRDARRDSWARIQVSSSLSERSRLQSLPADISHEKVVDCGPGGADALSPALRDNAPRGTEGVGTTARDESEQHKSRRKRSVRVLRGQMSPRARRSFLPSVPPM